MSQVRLIGAPARARGWRAWRSGVAVLALAAVATFAAAAGFVALDLEGRIAAAEEALVGTVSTVDVVVRDGDPWTLVTVDVERWWRRGGEPVPPGPSGADDPATLTAAFWGGRAPGADPLQVAGMPTFVAGERVIWLLRGADDGLAAPTVGVTQGVWRDVDGAWLGDDGSRLGLDENGDLHLDGQAVSDAALFDALDRAFDELEATP